MAQAYRTLPANGVARMRMHPKQAMPPPDRRVSRASVYSAFTDPPAGPRIDQQEKQAMKQVINWFEIPAANFERAVTFYENVFATKLRREEVNDMKLGVFPYDVPGPSGAVCKMPQLQPGPDGTLIYLNAGTDVAPVLARVNANGGTVVLDKTLIRDDIGYIGIFIDSEGNRVGVHAHG
jgi:predicted enzyme related to lactoylglutathione lyase